MPTFRLWAPRADTVKLRLQGQSKPVDYAMENNGSGYHSLTLPCSHGQLYQYVLDGKPLPDPASAFQPEGVHGPSMVVDFEFPDNDEAKWTGVPKDKLILYELHMGTFTQEGRYIAAIEQLDRLVDLGITAIELMPLAECPGRWNWGYDGVCLYAPSHNYGSPAELRAFIKNCHERGLAVILDVVYNHLGPEGNYLNQFGPYFGGDTTPWGTAPAVSGKAQRPVRDFFINNALHWIENYKFDGLRLDAITMINDSEAVHLANEIARKLNECSKRLNRDIHIIGETNLYRPELLPEQNGDLDALWIDDLAHALGRCIGFPETSSLRNYRGFPDVHNALRHGYLFEQKKDDTVHRICRSDTIQLENTVCYLQNHDIVGNRPHGKRAHHWANRKIQCATIALILLYPAIPLIFMGEEFSASSPFLFFTDFSDPELRKNVEQGRMHEFQHVNLQDTLSPINPEAFTRSKLPEASSQDKKTLEWYRLLIRIRKSWQSEGFLSTQSLRVIRNGGKRITLKYTRREQVRFVATDLAARVSTHFDADTEASICKQGKG
jgi:malto-oligosyltrehalose trehalohydrolase